MTIRWCNAGMVPQKRRCVHDALVHPLDEDVVESGENLLQQGL
jgi:hypothetical protein